MKRLMIYVCGHDENLQIVPDRPFLTKVNLHELPVGEFQKNAFSESRIFFSKLEPSEYVGFITATWKYKWPANPNIHRLDGLDYQPHIVWCGALETLEGRADWYAKSKFLFPELTPFIEEMVDFSGLSPYKKLAPISQNFICHWNVYQRFLTQWRAIFDHLYSKHSIEEVNELLATMQFVHHDRLYGYLCERITMLILSNMEGIELRETTQAKKNLLRLPRKLV